MESYAYLAHHGIKGQKWGNRRYQYKDGSLTPEGRRRYGVRKNETRKRVKAEYRAAVKAENKKLYKYGKNEIEKRTRVARRTGKILSSPSGVLTRLSIAALTGGVGYGVATSGGKALIKRALKNNPNLKLTDSDFTRLLNVAGKNGYLVGAALGAGATAYGVYRYSKAIEGKRSGGSSRKKSTSGSSSRKMLTSGSSGFASRKRKSDPWSEKPYNPYDYNWTERRSKNRSNI